MRNWRIIAALLATVALVLSTSSAASAADSIDPALRTVAGTRVLFGHQSVGWNILDGMAGLYARRGVTPPRMVDQVTALPAQGRGFAQQAIGENGRPRSKFADFAAAVDAGRNLRVAVMKLCFVDISGDTDPTALFAAYRRTISGIAARHPGVRLVHVTVPLTVPDPAANLARQHYNRLMRSTYGQRVFDLARIESTRPDGSRVAGHLHGERYFSLYRGYAADEGHLNSEGARRAARGFVQAVASAAG
ncbi:MAG: SGNH/GDSL hydrolase family protein [Candidatus Nanopelagicales bacterium]